MKSIFALVLIATISLISVQNVNGLKVLIVFPMFSPSHYILGHGLAKGLLQAGHDVTIISPFKAQTPLANYTEIVLEGLADFTRNGANGRSQPKKRISHEYIHIYNCFLHLQRNQNHFSSICIKCHIGICL